MACTSGVVQDADDRYDAAYHCSISSSSVVEFPRLPALAYFRVRPWFMREHFPVAADLWQLLWHQMFIRAALHAFLPCTSYVSIEHAQLSIMRMYRLNIQE